MVTVDVDDRAVVVPPAEAIAQMMRQQTDVLRRATDRIEEPARCAAEAPAVLAAPENSGAPLGGELRTGHDVPLLLES